MSNVLKQEKSATSTISAISFSKKYAASETFLNLFREGMELIEETSEYLEVEGRMEARDLSEQLALTYSTESMRLTTQLMQLASWLVVYRGIAENKLTPEDVEEKRKKIKFSAVSRVDHIENFSELPKGLRTLIQAAETLYDKIAKLDSHLLSAGFDIDSPRENPLSAQMAALEAAFGTAQQ